MGTVNADRILGGWMVRRRDQRWKLEKGKRDVSPFECQLRNS